jgi:hypothetical protein
LQRKRLVSPLWLSLTCMQSHHVRGNKCRACAHLPGASWQHTMYSCSHI